MKIITLLISTILFLITPAMSSMPKGVDWYVGPLEKAMKLSKKQSKPLFLYWGAVWCPPCNEMKKTVFSKSKFQSAIKKFIPVYLDGDDARAQKWGSKLNAKGYPTMIILGPLGNEIMRLPTGVAVESYVELMNIARSKLESMDVVLKRALAKKSTDNDWKLLSGFSWGQSELVQKADRLETFEKLYSLAPKEMISVKSRLLFLYLNEWLSLEKKTKLSVLIRSEFTNVLKNQELFLINLEIMTWYGVKLITNIFPKNKALLNIYLIRMQEAYNNLGLTIDQRVSTLYSQVKVEEEKFSGKDKVYSHQLKLRVLKVAQWAHKECKDEYDRQAAMSTAVYLLSKTNQLDEAHKMALAQLKKSAAPYYFMSYLAGIEKKRGNKIEALKWYRKAWKKSKGPATKFEWGVNYLNNILKLSPGKITELNNEMKIVFNHGMSLKDAFEGRNIYRFKSFKKSFDLWKKSNAKSATKTVVKSSKTLLADICSSSADTSRNKQCIAWVNTL